ncbi:histidine kinase [Aggregicoccus sp. 17bor-14]|uniref:sensor histidine kinase n=1 Tax=Myxococcaceae TaxID=31 RepID=UPI00129C9788|nr:MULTISPECIES: ATP-binding protein [Myxococcaceae]MBF5043926.1 GAF domain-containing protein [Simulacricoccus sp. 17bor-14]MRI89677.1 histidine kinase [Aggregicoccus sp. 17bor-14]
MTVASEHQALDGLPLPLLVVRTGRVVHASPALEALVGISREELLELTAGDLFARFLPAERAWLEPRHAASTRGEPLPDDVWLSIRVADGSERSLWCRALPGPGTGEQTLLILDAEREASARRLTEALATTAGQLMRCRTEEAVLEAAVEVMHREGFLAATLLLEGELLHHGPMRHDPEMVRLGERFYGRPIPQVPFPRASLPYLAKVLETGKACYHQDYLRELEGFHPPELIALFRQSYPSIRGLSAPFFVEGRVRGVIAVQSQALTPTSAATLGLFAQQVGAALENVRHHRAAAARLAELNQLQRDLVDRERLALLGEVGAVVAHEVRNPLGAILNAAAILRREARPGSASASAVQMLEEEALRLEAVVRDLLEVVRPLEPRLRPLPLGEHVRRALEAAEQRGEAGPGRLTYGEEPGLPPVSADPALLELALENLLRNSLQASPETSPVEVRLARAPGGVCLSVEDRGPEVAASDALRAFEPFFTTRATGTGLGLAVVRRVVLAQGGSVRAGPREGGGARFELTLPAASGET